MKGTSLRRYLLLNFLSEERKPQGEEKLMLISTPNDQKDFLGHTQL